MIHGTLVTTTDTEYSFPLYFGVNKENEIYRIFRHAWETQNIDTSGISLYKVMDSLVSWKIGLSHNINGFVNVKSKTDDGHVDGWVMPIKLNDFDTVVNSDFMGLGVGTKHVGISPKKWTLSPLLLNLTINALPGEKFHKIFDAGHFFIKGEADIYYDVFFDPVTFEKHTISNITDFKIESLNWINYSDNTEQKIF